MNAITRDSLLLVLIGWSTAGCTNQTDGGTGSSPLLRGEIVSVSISNERPFGSGPSNSWSTFAAGTVEIFPDFIALTREDGKTRVCPHGWYKNLVFTKDSQ